MKAMTLTAFATAILLSAGAYTDSAEAQQRGARGDGAKAAKAGRGAKRGAGNRAQRQKAVSTRTRTRTRQPTVNITVRTHRPITVVQRRGRRIGRIATPGIDARLRRLTRRTMRGVRRGFVPPRAARRIRNRLADIRFERRIARRDGVVTQRERRRLRRALNQVDNRLFRFGA